MAHHAGAKYQSDMPAFKGKLTDAEIWAAIAYIKSKWPERIQKKRRFDPAKK
jgi:mono/diheme cytochrome c family protein